MVGDETSPQHAFARACAAFADDEDHAQRLYDYVSKHWFMFSTPVLSNGGTTRGLPISCFLATIPDSREGISEHFDEVIWLSSTGGGIGTYFGLREKGSKTSKGSQSTGIIPFISVDDRLILAVSQGGTRRGSHAVYIDVHHPEIREFLGIRKPTGGDANRKALNLHHGVNVTDEFLHCIKTGQPFPLRSPKDNAIVGWDNARDLWHMILETRKQTGEPYLFNVDEANRKLPKTQRDLGLRVNHSNLCVDGATELLTKDGYRPIEALAGTTVSVWNGETYSDSPVEKTSDSSELVRVWFEDGSYLDCTPYHKFYDENGAEIRAGVLTEGTVLETSNHPTLTGQSAVDSDLAYTAGFTTFSGYHDDNSNRLTAFAPDTTSDVMLRRLMVHSVDMTALAANYDEDGHFVEDSGHALSYPPKTVQSGFVPFSWDRTSALMWLGGAFDAVGTWFEDDVSNYYCIGTDDRQLVRHMRLLALQLGFHPRIRLTDTCNVFMLHASEIKQLIDAGALLGFEDVDVRSKPLDLSMVVSDVQPLAMKAATYCLNESLRHKVVFNGVLTGQCTEITLATGLDVFGKQRTAVCCLSSTNADKFDEWKHAPHFIEDLMRMLDNVLTVFIETAPSGLKNAIYSAKRERAVGLGMLGFHSYLQRHNVPFESEEARIINKMLFGRLHKDADAASLKLGAERGEAPDMVGTGHRFSHKIAVAPNASSSILCGNVSPSVEPIPANAFLQKTLTGSNTHKNQHLVTALDALGLNIPAIWKAIIANAGSLQNLDQPVLGPDGEWGPSLLEELGYNGSDAEFNLLKSVYKTSMEIKQRWVIQLAIDRKDDIDQAQSINLFYPADFDADEISQDHFHALYNGLKSLYYLRSTAAKRGENVNKVVTRQKMDIANDVALPTIEGLDLAALVAAAGDVVADEECWACQG